MLLYWTRMFFVTLALVLPLVLARMVLSSERNLRVVEPGVLYRSGQLPLPSLERVVHDYGIRTVVSLRETSGDEVSEEMRIEQTWCQNKGLNFHALPARSWDARPGEDEAPAQANIRKLLGILDDAKNHPVLIHCFRGVHRTGVYCAVCRIERQGWPIEKAIAEMRSAGYHEYDQHQDVQHFLANYRRQR